VPLVGEVRREKRHDWGSRGGGLSGDVFGVSVCGPHAPREGDIQPEFSVFSFLYNSFVLSRKADCDV